VAYAGGRGGGDGTSGAAGMHQRLSLEVMKARQGRASLSYVAAFSDKEEVPKQLLL
jgi:hypothetical protein